MLKKTMLGLLVTALLPIIPAPAFAQGEQALDIRVAYIGQIIDRGPVLSNLIPEPEDAGLQGARLAITDSNSTGRFLKHHYRLDEIESDDPSTLITDSRALYDEGARLFVLNTSADTLAALSSSLPEDALLINSGSYDDDLRSEQCLSGMLHTLPSRAMLADALAQWLIMRRWNRWMLISGNTDDDRAFAQSIKRAAKRFGGKIVAEKAWSFDTDLRRTAQKELPPFTSGTEYDVVVVADERGDFGEYLPYNTGLPRPVVGTQGLMPTAWHKMIEAWGAAQLHSRFEKQTGRWMNEKDYASWAGVRVFAEAVTRTGSTDAAALRDFILSDQFELAAFKGRKLNFRSWSGQLRQPIALVHPRALVSSSPQEGFLHPVTDLDTLGFDAPESRCRVIAQ
ncbi:branched-chain amino acid ABC transporter substrate-binding protein [Marinobacterium zhoushanense]|uniref:Branched-chain amino acid ABC transporter substrate-binding protein n=1 Tax=Marinobacterium zhoushanense TaxID=1679163 RepID=A0ABQ1KE80_9GAMM|nr:ABC transporter substrate-binding protein [Marinobacterium zhoushanense]GGB93261.1 branched-chain amino acid ABC transporter substrate-binding protein [Marinobacterium zhoushanense]